MENFISKKLFELCKSNKVNQLENLAEIITDFNIEDDTKKTPLMYACEYGCVEIVDILLKKGADINKTSLSNLNAIQYAEKNNHIDIVYKLLINDNLTIKNLDNLNLIKAETLCDVMLMYKDNFNSKLKQTEKELSDCTKTYLIGIEIEIENIKQRFKYTLLEMLVKYKNKQNNYLSKINILIELLKNNVQEIIPLNIICNILFTKEELNKLRQDKNFFELLLENDINVNLFFKEKSNDSMFWIISIIGFLILILICV